MGLKTENSRLRSSLPNSRNDGNTTPAGAEGGREGGERKARFLWGTGQSEVGSPFTTPVPDGARRRRKRRRVEASTLFRFVYPVTNSRVGGGGKYAQGNSIP